MLNLEGFIGCVKKHKIKTLFFLIGLLLGPLIVVHLLFKWSLVYDFISAEWTAGDLIGYIAGFEAFAGTVILGIIAVWQTDKANKTNDNLLKLTEQIEKKSVLPFFSFNSYITKYEGDNIINMFAKVMPESKSNEDATRLVPNDNNSKRTDFLLSEINFSISHDQIETKSELTKEQQENISSQFGIIKHASGASITASHYRYKKVCVENCGKGSAINVKCRLYKIGQEAKDKFDIETIPFTVPTERHFDIGLYFDLSKDIYGQYTLEITYHDIYSNKYMQPISLKIFEEESSIDFYQPQIQLKNYNG